MKISNTPWFHLKVSEVAQHNLSTTLVKTKLCEIFQNSYFLEQSWATFIIFIRRDRSYVHVLRKLRCNVLMQLHGKYVLAMKWITNYILGSETPMKKEFLKVFSFYHCFIFRISTIKHSLHKIWENTGFHRPVFSRIRIES